MAKPVAFRDLIEKNLFGDPDWGPFARGSAPIPEDRPQSAHIFTTYLFYIGKHRRARDAASLSALYSEGLWQEKPPDLLGLPHLFRAGLYWSLAGDQDRATQDWKQLTGEFGNAQDERLVATKHAQLWICVAYVLVKLGDFSQVRGMVEKGRIWLDRGKGTFKAPHRNSLAYALGPLLLKLVDHFELGAGDVDAGVQQAFVRYKTENARYGRLGYPVIFDLQASYPDVLEPVLPGPDPEKD